MAKGVVVKLVPAVAVVLCALAWALPAGAATSYGNERLLPTGAGLLFPTGMAVDANDDIFIADVYNSSDWELAADGTWTRISPPYPDSLASHDITVDNAGTVWESGYFWITEVPRPPYTGSYQILRAGGLESPQGIVADNLGNIYVVDSFYNDVIEYNIASGSSQVVPFGSLNQPYGLARDQAGDLFVADMLDNRIVERTAAGVIQTLPFTGLSYPSGIAVDQSGDVFVADRGNGRVVELAPDGTQTTLPFTHLGTFSGNFQGDVGGPIAVSVDPAGNVFALDRGSNHVWELSPVTPQTVAFNSTAPADAVVGGTYAPVATGGGSGNPVTFSVDGTSTPGACTVSGGTVSFTGTGTCVVDADQAGNGSYSAAPTVNQSFTIAPAPQAIAFATTPPSGATYGGTYNVAAVGGGSGNPVVFSVDPASTTGACSVSGTAVSFTGPGTCTVDADQAGNGSYLPAPTVSQSFTIAQAPQAIAFTTTPPSGAAVGGGDVVAATGGVSGNPVTFSVDAASTAGACSVSGSAITFSGVGRCIIDADQAGNADYTAASQVSQTFSIGKGTPVVTWSPGTINFGTALGPLQLDAVASVAGSFA